MGTTNNHKFQEFRNFFLWIYLKTNSFFKFLKSKNEKGNTDYEQSHYQIIENIDNHIQTKKKITINSKNTNKQDLVTQNILKIIKSYSKVQKEFINSGQIRKILKMKYEMNISEVALRKKIKKLRVQGFPIIAKLQGYFLTNSISELNDYVLFRRKEILQELIALEGMCNGQQI